MTEVASRETQAQMKATLAWSLEQHDQKACPNRAMYVIHYPVFGGPHNQARRLAGPLRERGWDTVVVLPDQPGNAGGIFDNEGIKYVRIQLNRARATLDPRPNAKLLRAFAGDVLRIRQQIRAYNPDVLMIGGLINPQAAIAARLEGVPLVWEIVDSRTPGMIRKLLMPIVDRLSDAVLYCGNTIRDLHRQGRPDRVPSFLYVPPVDAATFVPSEAIRTKRRVQLGIPLDAPVCGMVANLNRQKGIEFFIRAARLIESRIPGARFVVIGASYDKAYAKQLWRELERSGLGASQYFYVGPQSDVQSWYPMMDVKMITSVPASEGIATTAIEAMSCGVPVVSTRVGGLQEVIEPGVTGFVVEPLDPVALADAATRVLANRLLRGSMGAACRKAALTRFDIQPHADERVRVFEAAVDHSSARRRNGS